MLPNISANIMPACVVAFAYGSDRTVAASGSHGMPSDESRVETSELVQFSDEVHVSFRELVDQPLAPQTDPVALEGSSFQ
jgi:hypothetical protein